VSDTINDAPAPEDIREAVERVTVSDVFARSPQLGAFLRFVVEAVLHGKADRIKAYTIGVEVLRRDVKFDPQLDPIVRVEATRLRRTIERYYSGSGADDRLIIDLPRGSYVPTFRWREPDATAAEEVAPQAAMDWRGVIQSRWGIAALTAVVLLLVFGIGTALLTRGPMQQADTTVATRDAARPASVLHLQPGNGMPSIYIEPLRVTGTPASQALSVDTLAEKIGDAFARFDTINVVYAPRVAAADVPVTEPRSDYRLAGAVEYGSADATVQFRLIDVGEGNVVWSRSFDRVAPGEQGVAEEQIVFALADSLLQSYGVIRSRDRAKQLVSNTSGDPRYRCILEAADAIRTLNTAEHERAKACIDQLTTADPSFALGYTFLAILYGRDYLFGAPQRADAEPVLDRALRAARRAIELNPASSRNWTVLMVVLFHRHEVPEAFAAGEKALMLNKYDSLAPAEYGGRLIMVGETERGLAMMRRAIGANVVRPSWQHFYLFMGAYLSGDMKEAGYQAGQITEPNYALGHLARALVASATGDAERARQAIERLVALQAGWRSSPRLELVKLSPNPLIVDRLAKDLAKAGLPGS
jgi:Tfp pilus assembly protein PilF